MRKVQKKFFQSQKGFDKLLFSFLFFLIDKDLDKLNNVCFFKRLIISYLGKGNKSIICYLTAYS